MAAPPPTDPTWLPWTIRVAWLSLPLTAGTVLADALTSRSTPVQVVSAALAWSVWAVVVLGLLVRRPVALTALRCAAPLAFLAAVWGATRPGGAAGGPLLTGLAAVPLLLAFLPESGAWLVNGAAYGYERRYPLRAPGALLLGPLPVAWVLLVAGTLTGPLLLAAGQWVLGGAATVAGAALAAVLARSLHSLSLRWAVLVPAGLVLKDHVTMLDPVLFERAGIAQLAPAPSDTDALDLTARSPGLALELRLHDDAPLTLTDAGRRQGHSSATKAILFTPTRPGALLAAAAAQRIPTA